MVLYDFPQSGHERYVKAFDRAIAMIEEQDENDHVGRAAAMGDATTDVLAVSLLAGQDRAQPWVERELPAFREHVRDALRRHRPALAAWLGTIDVALWQRNRDGWYRASLGRSAAEVLVHEEDDGDDPLVPPHRLAEVDEEMRDIGPGLNALPPEVIPRGLPESHWWWHLPQGPNEPDTDAADYSY